MLAHGHPHPHPHTGDGGGGADHPHDHVHAHDHAHDHVHPHPHAAEAKHVVAQAAVLDIGGDIGAVLVNTGAALEGEEIELYQLDGTYLMHTEVHGREVAGAQRYAGLFPAVQEGTYLLDTCDGSPRQQVVVTGGQVAVLSQARAEAPARTS